MAEYKAHNQTAAVLLNANESPWNLPEDLRAEIAGNIQALDFNRYPDDTMEELLAAASDLYGFAPEQILAGNGSDQMLQLLINTYVKPKGTLAVISPDFGMYDFYAGQLDADVLRLDTDENGNFSIEKLAALAKENNAGLVLFSNPNNPTGHVVSKEDVRKLAELIAPIRLCCDEAYMDFSDQSAMEYVGRIPNLFVTRTLSKAWAAAGIRCGFLFGSRESMEQLEKNKVVYSVSTPDSAAAMAIMKRKDLMQARVKEIIENREYFIEQLQTLPVDIIPTGANFVSISLPGGTKQLEEAVFAAGIAVRVFAHHRFMRITIGTREQMDLLLKVIRDFFLQKNTGPAQNRNQENAGSIREGA